LISNNAHSLSQPFPDALVGSLWHVPERVKEEERRGEESR